jgi:hypothetical protein
MNDGPPAARRQSPAHGPQPLLCHQRPLAGRPRGPRHRRVLTSATNSSSPAGAERRTDSRVVWPRLRELFDVGALESGGQGQWPAPDKDPPSYPIADAIASQNTVKSPANGCCPCSITCWLRRFPWESVVLTNDRNPASFTKVLLAEV